MRHPFRRASAMLLMVGLMLPVWAADREVVVPGGTQIYVETDRGLISKKGQLTVGEMVPSHIWRDVIVDGEVIIEAGTPVVVRVDDFKHNRIAGRKGWIVLGAYETTSVDQQAIKLDGGYHKQGKDKIALTGTLAAVVLWPLIFMKGKAANLPAGTVFDAYVPTQTRIAVNTPAPTPAPPPPADAVAMDIEVLYDRLESEKKVKNLEIEVHADGAVETCQVPAINGEPIEKAIPVNRAADIAGGMHGEIELKPLVKRFQKGINTFDVECVIAGRSIDTEVVLQIQI